MEENDKEFVVEAFGELSEEDRKSLREAILKRRKEMGWKKRLYWKFKGRYLCYKFRFQDFIRGLKK